jgi:hypothetical protein
MKKKTILAKRKGKEGVGDRPFKNKNLFPSFPRALTIGSLPKHEGNRVRQKGDWKRGMEILDG